MALTNVLSGCIHAHLQSAMEGDTQSVRHLLDHGVDVNAIYTGESGRTLLHAAAYGGSFETVQTLLDRGADVNAKDDFGIVPLHFAVFGDYFEVVQLLLEHEANVNAMTNDNEILYPNATSLHIASILDYSDIGRLLLDGGANVDVKGGGGRTPLYEALRHGNRSFTKLLVERGADPTVPDNDGVTPLQFAQHNNDSETILLLNVNRQVENQTKPPLVDPPPSQSVNPGVKRQESSDGVPPTTLSPGDLSISLSYPPDGHHTTGEILSIIGLIHSERGVSQVELSVNGRPIQGARDLVVTEKREGNFPLYNQVTLTQGENIVGITVFDNEGGAAQVVRRVYRDSPVMGDETVATKPIQKRKRWAVVIGIDQYQDTGITSLTYAVADAKAVYDFLTTQGGVNPTHARLLLNSQATQRKIRSVLGEFLREKAIEDDEVIIYYAGHGTTEPDPGAEGGLAKYLVPWDADPDSLFSTAIPMSEIDRVFLRLSARKVLLIQDTCFSGGSGGRTFLSKKGIVRAGSLSDQFLQDLSRKEGRMILASSDINQLSQEDQSVGHGLFTYFFLEGVKGGADLDHDGAMTVREIHLFLQRKVHERSGGTQTPQLYSLGDMVLLQTEFSE